MDLLDSVTDLERVQSVDAPFGVPRLMWCFWSEGDMGAVRSLSLSYLVKNVGVPVFLVTRKSFFRLEKPEFPIHPAFRWLSAVHQSDYVRTYLWHHYGGAWHDVKATEVSYFPLWDHFEDELVYFLGRPEVRGGAATLYDDSGRWMPDCWHDLVSVIAWIGRPNTPFSREMMERMHLFLDQNLDTLKANPARHPREKKAEGSNAILRAIKKAYFSVSKRSPGYPIPWTLFGNIFHPLNFKYKEHVRALLPSDRQKNAGIYHRN